MAKKQELYLSSLRLFISHGADIHTTQVFDSGKPEAMIVSIVENICKKDLSDTSFSLHLTKDHYFNNHFNKCLAELKKLKQFKLLKSSCVTLYHILTASERFIDGFARNKVLVAKLSSLNFNEYTIYEAEMKSKKQSNEENY